MDSHVICSTDMDYRVTCSTWYGFSCDLQYWYGFSCDLYIVLIRILAWLVYSTDTDSCVACSKNNGIWMQLQGFPIHSQTFTWVKRIYLMLNEHWSQHKCWFTRIVNKCTNLYCDVRQSWRSVWNVSCNMHLKSSKVGFSNECVTGWFSMSPLPKLHHHDIITFVTPCHDKKK